MTGHNSAAATAAEDRRQYLILRLCRLQRTITERAVGYEQSTDCFCRVPEGDDRHIVPMHSWHNSGIAVDFIEQAVAEKLDRDRISKTAAAEHVRARLAQIAAREGVTADDLAQAVTEDASW